MKTVLFLAILTSSIIASASEGKGFCEKQAREHMLNVHHKILDNIGVIQGYSENISFVYTVKRNQMDQADETFHYSIMAGNDEGDWWVWEHKVQMEAWLSAGGRAHICDLIKMEYLGVTDSGNPWEDDN